MADQDVAKAMRKKIIKSRLGPDLNLESSLLLML
jgi:hypothetical protein